MKDIGESGVLAFTDITLCPTYALQYLQGYKTQSEALSLEPIHHLPPLLGVS